MDGDAGLCAISGVGVFAAMIVVSPSSLPSSLFSRRTKPSLSKCSVLASDYHAHRKDKGHWRMDPSDTYLE